ncbi:MAG: glycoside hydrolase family protein [Desulfarculales bacterium]|jgi:lysozyme|nr:glycoside hydrolase family protein [Desulfarculales bacterium]
MFEQLIEQLKRHEGFRAKIYLDTVGKRTIGYGRNIDDVPLSASELRLLGGISPKEIIEKGVSKAQAETLLILEIQRLHAELKKNLSWFPELDEARQAVLINMAFNLGIKGLLGFTNTLRNIELGSYAQAARNMLASKWAGQVKGRAAELAKQMETGQWQ